LYEATKETSRNLNEMGHIVKIKSFQNIDVSDIEERKVTKELMGHNFLIKDPSDEYAQEEAYNFLYTHDAKKVHKDWIIAEFQERIGRWGNVNPGDAWMLRRNIWEEFLNSEHKMDYVYNERYYAWDALPRIIENLKKDLYSRRCVLQVYQMDKDLAGVEELKRVPCSLDYSWLYRENKLNIFYHMRSCDFYEHFLNDMILTSWLNEFVARELEVVPGELIVSINSLHAYKKDLDERKIF
jgi:thymidylate synthase